MTADFFRARIDAMINLNDPLAMLATRLPWTQIEASLVAKFERQERAGQVLEGHDMSGPTLVLEGAGTSNAGRPKLPIRLMASLLYLKPHCMRPRSNASTNAKPASPASSASRAPSWSRTSTA